MSPQSIHEIKLELSLLQVLTLQLLFSKIENKNKIWNIFTDILPGNVFRDNNISSIYDDKLFSGDKYRENYGITKSPLYNLREKSIHAKTIDLCQTIK